MRRHKPFIVDLTGRHFGRLTVLAFAGKRKGSTSWRCKCDCGRTKIIAGYSMQKKLTKSCGCLHSEVMLTHGNAVRRKMSREYVIWCGAKARCSNPNNPGYRNYGGRGIKMCQRWRVSFVLFLADMGRCPAGLTLERKNNNRGYSPSNCIWASRKVQGNNQRRCRWLTFRGETLNLTQWAQRKGVSKSRIRGRLRLGWSVRKTLGTP